MFESTMARLGAAQRTTTGKLPAAKAGGSSKQPVIPQAVKQSDEWSDRLDRGKDTLAARNTTAGCSLDAIELPRQTLLHTFGAAPTTPGPHSQPTDKVTTTACRSCRLRQGMYRKQDAQRFARCALCSCQLNGLCKPYRPSRHRRQGQANHTATSARRNMLDSDKASGSAGGGYTGLFSWIGRSGRCRQGAMDVAPGSAEPVRETPIRLRGFGTASAASGHAKRCLEPSHHRPQRESQRTNRLVRPRTPAWPMRCLPR
jgi:hypothetical protein